MPSSGGLSLPARLAVSRGLGADQPAFWVHRSRGAITARNARQRVSATFSAPGARLSAAGGTVGLSLANFGHASALAPVGVAHTLAARNRVTYTYGGGLTQSWSDGPLGFEQSLVVARAPVSGSGALVFGFGVSGSLHARQSGASIEFVNAAGRVVLRYGDLSATDARGRVLPSHMSVRGGRLLVAVGARGARYPITVDPLVQVAKLTASDGLANDGLGGTGGIAASGNAVVVGAPAATVGVNDGQGAAYVWPARLAGPTPRRPRS